MASRWLWGVVIVIVLAGIQAGLAARLEIHGVPPDIVLVGVMAYAMTIGGPVRGAVLGLAAGLVLDLMGGGPLGLFALATGMAGWLCGEAGGRFDLESGWVRWLVAMVIAGVYGGIVIVGSRFVGRDAVNLTGAVEHALLAAPYDGLLAALASWPTIFFRRRQRALRWGMGSPAMGRFGA